MSCMCKQRFMHIFCKLCLFLPHLTYGKHKKSVARNSLQALSKDHFCTTLKVVLLHCPDNIGTTLSPQYKINKIYIKKYYTKLHYWWMYRGITFIKITNSLSM